MILQKTGGESGGREAAPTPPPPRGGRGQKKQIVCESQYSRHVKSMLA